MDAKRLKALWRDLNAARRSPQTAGQLEALAKRCERHERAGGNHPVWVTDHFPHRPIPIGRHGGNRTLPAHATKVILNALEADAAAWEAHLASTSDESNHDGQYNDGD